MYLVQHSRNLVFVVLVRKMTADAVHGESQDGIRLFLCYNKSSEIQQENSDCSYSNGEWQFMNQVIQTVLAAFSNQNIEINTARKLANLKKLDPLHLWVEKEDIVIKNRVWEDSFEIIFPIRRDKKAERRDFLRDFLSMEEDGLQRV